jgi:hypothetical protein
MKRDMIPNFQVHIEAGRRDVCDALRKASLIKEYQHWIHDSVPYHEDDPDAGFFGAIPVSSMDELVKVLTTLDPVVDQMALWCQAGDQKIGFNVFLGYGRSSKEDEALAEWRCDETVIAKDLSDAIGKASKILGEALTKYGS